VNQYLLSAAAAIVASFAGGIAMYLAAAPVWAYWIVAEISVTIGGLAYCWWWINDRLIALPDDPGYKMYQHNLTLTTGPPVDKYGVGLVLYVDPADDWSSWPGNYDTDYTFSLLLQGIRLIPSGTPGNEYAQDDFAGSLTYGLNEVYVFEPSPYAYLINEQKATNKLGLGFGGHLTPPDPPAPQLAYPQGTILPTFDGSGTSVSNGGTYEAPTLHCEIEGAGVADLQKFLYAALAIELAALLASFAGPAGAAILAIIAFLVALFGALFSPSQGASQSDVSNAPSSPLHTPDGQGHGGDIIGVTGTWVYDTAHSGWNELHPVKSIVPIGNGESDSTGASTAALIADGNEAMANATSTSTLSNQELPQNQWLIHPLVDGCGSYPSIPPPPKPQQPQAI
jgi:hypothetical protein